MSSENVPSAADTIVLAMDTSTGFASVALYGPGVLWGEHTWWSGQNHSVELLANISRLLGQAKIAVSEVGALAVAIGPGSYNGLRVGVSTAKGLAYALKKPLIGVSTLEVLAYQHSNLTLPIRPLLDAGRGEVVTALYRNFRRVWRQLEGQRVTSVDALCQMTERRTLFCGEISPVAGAELRHRLGNKAIVVSQASSARRAGYLAELAWRRWQEDRLDDPTGLQPVYIRRPPIGIK